MWAWEQELCTDGIRRENLAITDVQVLCLLFLGQTRMSLVVKGNSLSFFIAVWITCATFASISHSCFFRADCCIQILMGLDSSHSSSLQFNSTTLSHTNSRMNPITRYKKAHSWPHLPKRHSQHFSHPGCRSSNDTAL